MSLLHFLCPICGRVGDNYMEPCPACEREMTGGNFITCRYCAVDLAGSDSPCPDCRSEAHALDGLTAYGAWKGSLRVWVSALKFGGDTRMAWWLSVHLAEMWRETWPGVTLVPVPPRPIRIFRNGTDPVGIITGYLRKQGVPIARLLKRRGRQAQKTLDRDQRKQGLNLDYRLRRRSPVPEKSYVLFDDISTTGSTLTFCAELLKNAGAEFVYGFVICKD